MDWSFWAAILAICGVQLAVGAYLAAKIKECYGRISGSSWDD